MLERMNSEDRFHELREMIQREIEVGHFRKMKELLVRAIADRREKDTMDILAGIEIESDWSTACDLLLEVEDATYVCPIGIENPVTELEPLKYREVIFSIFYSSGLEPVDIPTKKMINEVRACESMSSACNKFSSISMETARKQFDSGDTLFFNPMSFAELDGGFLNRLHSTRQANLIRINSLDPNSPLDITPLWSDEICRRHLIDLGITGRFISDEDFSDVLSVIQQVSKGPPDSETIGLSEEFQLSSPSNKKYHQLHEALIDQNIADINALGSKHAVSVLKNVTESNLLTYRTEETSRRYREFLDSINSHVIVRSNDSIVVFQKIIEEDFPRILTPVITALSNFYDESSASVIASILCRTISPTILEHCVRSIKNLYTKCPEVLPQVKSMLNEDCHNHQKLEKLVKEFSKRESEWYYKYY